MKKLVGLLAILIIGTTIAIASTSMPYARKCTKCQEELKKALENGATCYFTPGIMQRDFGTPHRKINGHMCTLYKCEFGHQVWVRLDDDKEEE